MWEFPPRDDGEIGRPIKKSALDGEVGDCCDVLLLETPLKYGEIAETGGAEVGTFAIVFCRGGGTGGGCSTLY